MSAIGARTRFLSHAWLISFGLMLALLLLNGFISYLAIVRLINNEDKIYHTLNTLNVIKGTFSAIQDAETGERGYLISGEDTYLEPYNEAIEEINVQLNHLLQLDSQRPRIHTLTLLAQAKLAEMSKTIELRRQNKNADAIELFLTDEGNALMQQMRNLVRELQQTEYQRLAQQRHEAQTVRHQIILTLVFATVLGILFAAVVYVLVGRFLKRQQQDAELLAITNEDLETIVAERTMVLERYAVELQNSNRELQDFAFVGRSSHPKIC
jgi:CHASE3 domain sensor protein